MPQWGADLDQIDFDDIHYFVRASERAEHSWDDVPEDIKNTFDKLGIPEAERKFLAGVGAQYESEVVYHQVREDLEKQGVIFMDMDTGLREHEDIVREYFATVDPAPTTTSSPRSTAPSGRAARSSTCPKGVKVEMPLQAYFRINTENMGQFERTLIIADEGADVHYIEGCTAPIYSTDSLHSAVVELIAQPGARIRYTTIQNWSHERLQPGHQAGDRRTSDATVEWVDCNLGSKLTMKYPSIYLMGEGAHGEILSIAFAGKGQHQDAGGKIIHAAPNTTSLDLRQVDLQGRRPQHLPRPARGRQGRHRGRARRSSATRCCSTRSRAPTPTRRSGSTRTTSTSATRPSVSKIGEEQLFYLQCRGLDEEEASKMIVNGFIEPIVKELPMEYAVEMNRLIELQMEGSIG